MLRLVVMTGLPCSGKSTVAYGLAARLGWPVFSVDPIDSAMRGEGIDAEAAGAAAYGVAARLASEQLGVGLSVIVDGCNADRALHDMWLELAGRTGARLDVIECATAEPLHRARVTGRVRGLAHYPEVTWDFVEEMRGYFAPWETHRLRLDTGAATPAELVARAAAYVTRPD
jgi:predicted kinase